MYYFLDILLYCDILISDKEMILYLKQREKTMTQKTKDNMVSFGKAGKDNVRLEACKALVGKTFTEKNRKEWNISAQATKGKVILSNGTRKGKMAMLGAIASGKYKGNAQVIKLPKTDGQSRSDYAIKLLSPCNIKWDSVMSVGSLSR